MLVSLALMLLLGLLASELMKQVKLPPLIGMILIGIILGPYVLNWISNDLLAISADFRKIALIVILLRAGLSLDIKDLIKIGRPAFLMCFVPASFEIIATVIVAPLFFNISYIEAAILGTVLSAVSPAVVVSKMLKLMEEGYGTKKKIPQLILAGASVDDVYVIVLFTSFMSMYGGNDFNALQLLEIPVSIVSGLVIGFILGSLSNKLFKIYPLNDTVKILILLSIALLLNGLEAVIINILPMSALLAVMAVGLAILKQNQNLAVRLSVDFSKIWIFAELLLFILVGASVNLNYVSTAGFNVIFFILLLLIFRSFGVYVSLLRTPLSLKERLFCMVAYLPKATVQAAIGGLPLAAGVGAGNLILTVAVAAILVTAPLGAIGIDYVYPRVLEKE